MVLHHPIWAVLKKSPQLLWRWLAGAIGMGTALVTGLLKGCLNHGCQVALNARAVAPIVERGRVTGETAAENGIFWLTWALSWPPAGLNGTLMREKHFPGSFDFLSSPEGDGDAHRIAIAASAELAHMDHANISAGIPLNASRRPFGIGYFIQEPNALIVDRHGRCFVNEYRVNLGEVIDERDPPTGQPVHLPEWLVSDHAFLKNSPIRRHFASRHQGWMHKGKTIAALAEATGLPADELERTSGRFNAYCASGADELFHRENPVLGQAKITPEGWPSLAHREGSFRRNPVQPRHHLNQGRTPNGCRWAC